MDYFTILNLEREPFSNSPDPDFFFQSRQHVDCLQKLELALRLKRGLSIVIGAVGSGKTTLCRTLLKKFSSDSTIESHLILDPSFNSPLAFLESICSMIVDKDISGSNEQRFKEQIKQHLYKKGVDEKKTVILIIDEGQKLPVFCLEILREFLNYETNEHKLLQIVLFAQEEFQEILDRRANLADRVNLSHFLGPMNFADTGEMINFRIKHASNQPRPPKLFTGLALRAIYRATGGYPRKIINLCHQCMLALIVQNRTRVGWRLVRSCTDRSLAQHSHTGRKSYSLVFSALAVFATIGLLYLLAPGLFPSVSLSIGHKAPVATAVPKGKPVVKPNPDPIPETMAFHKKNPQNFQNSNPVPLLDKTISTTVKEASSPSPVMAVVLPDQPVEPVTMDPVYEMATTDTQTEKVDGVKPAPPSLLGALTVKRNDTLGQMVKVIYGDFRSRYLKAVLDANPHIGHADAIRVGDTIAFPTIPVSFVQRSYPLWWLKVGEAKSLEAAFRQSISTSQKTDGPLMRIISDWDHQTGLRYGIFVFGYFFNHSAANTMMTKLPAELSGSAEITSGWPAEMVLFADPFLGKGY